MEPLISAMPAIVAVALFGLGAKTVFAPTSMLDNFGIDPRGPVGLNTLRGVIGGLFFGATAMLVSGLATEDPTWFFAAAQLLTAVAAGRLLGLAVDGFEKTVIPPLVLETVMIAILVGAYVNG
ncbi:MAG: hypothetical protein AAF389_20035 [Gemmatimonadota bacterium]